MAKQEKEWISIDDIGVKKYEPGNIVDACCEIRTPLFDGNIVPIWSEEIEG